MSGHRIAAVIVHRAGTRSATASAHHCMDALARALRAKDINALMAHYAPDVVTFDLMPLQTQGADAYRKNFEAWFASVQGPIAFGHYLGRVISTRTTGEKNDYWVRVSAGLQKMNGGWRLTHEHVSVPFKNTEALQAALAYR
ncbi:MAG TPA: nuclear transport factor 2 family protein [Burkholderiales bacterium]|nr:nuclear transport factor 2 family protein [Burkholderiales bacterium]